MSTSHRFRVGQHVRYFAACDVLNTHGDFVIVRSLPIEQDGPQYQIRAESDGRLRRALEHELRGVPQRAAAASWPDLERATAPW